jgi:hypothetical protein
MDSYPSSENSSKHAVAGLRMILCDSREGMGHSYLSSVVT